MHSVSADSVLLIIADDLGRDSLAKFNDDPSASLPPTPTINALAENGITFNRTYAYSSCSPTRSSILTGRYDFRTGVRSPEINTLQPNEFTLAEAIVASGQIDNRLAQLGKWHLGGSADAPNTIGGWPHFAGSLGGGVPDYSRWTKVVDGTSTNRYSTYATTDLVNDASNWIEAQGAQDWFLWVAFNAPHTPYHKPDNALHDYDQLSGTDEDIVANPRPYYEAMVQAMDSEIERLLEAVDLGTTTVIFIGDNGTPNGVLQAPFPRRHGKGSLYEGGVNVPMIISGAAVANELNNTVSNALIHSVDLYATILDLLDIDRAALLPNELVYDSKSFYNILTADHANHTRSYAFAAQPGTTADTRNLVLTNDLYRWILSDDGSQEFYYLADGLAETQNRINTLSSDASDALSAFQSELTQMQNIPKVHQQYISNNQFNISLGWFANAQLSLQFKTDLNEASWQDVSSFIISDNGTSTLTLTDAVPLETRRFYRVISN